MACNTASRSWAGLISSACMDAVKMACMLLWYIFAALLDAPQLVRPVAAGMPPRGRISTLSATRMARMCAPLHWHRMPRSSRLAPLTVAAGQFLRLDRDCGRLTSAPRHGRLLPISPAGSNRSGPETARRLIEYQPIDHTQPPKPALALEFRRGRGLARTAVRVAENRLRNTSYGKAHRRLLRMEIPSCGAVAPSL
jgi:hypothetical protein